MSLRSRHKRFFKGWYQLGDLRGYRLNRETKRAIWALVATRLTIGKVRGYGS